MPRAHMRKMFFGLSHSEILEDEDDPKFPTDWSDGYERTRPSGQQKYP